MKKLVLAAVVAASPNFAFAGDSDPSPYSYSYDPTFFLGLVWAFGGPESGSVGSNGLGIGLKYLSTNEPDTLAAGVGVTYYFDGTFGCDIGGAVNHGRGSFSFGYDICRRAPQIGLGGIQEADMVSVREAATIISTDPD